MHKLLEVPRRNFARARLTILLAPLVAPKGVILVLRIFFSHAVPLGEWKVHGGQKRLHCFCTLAFVDSFVFIFLCRKLEIMLAAEDRILSEDNFNELVENISKEPSLLR